MSPPEPFSFLFLFLLSGFPLRSELPARAWRKRKIKRQRKEERGGHHFGLHPPFEGVTSLPVVPPQRFAPGVIAKGSRRRRKW
jgi:hypothetical protein